MHALKFQISIPLEIVNSAVFDSFSHFLARMEWSCVLQPGRYTIVTYSMLGIHIITFDRVGEVSY